MTGPSNNQIVGIALAVVVGGMGIASVWDAKQAAIRDAAPSADGAIAEHPKLSADAVAKCRSVIATGLKTGIIKARPEPNRIDVEDRLWGEVDARTKEMTLRSLVCDIWGTATPPSGEFVVSYGYRSGKRIEMLSELGVTRE